MRLITQILRVRGIKSKTILDYDYSNGIKEGFFRFTLDIAGVNRDVQFHYGDQKELLLWIKNRGNYPKYPLIWYVLNKYTEV